MYMTVPALAVNVPPVPLNTVPARLKFIMLEPPFSVPAVLVHVPVNVWVKPVPRLSVPLAPLIVNPPPFTLPVNVAVPVAFVIETVPVVVLRDGKEVRLDITLDPPR